MFRVLLMLLAPSRPGTARSAAPRPGSAPSAGPAGAAAREGPALAAGLAPRPRAFAGPRPTRGRHGASAPRPRCAHLGDAGPHEAAADNRDMFDEQLLGGRRGGVGGGGANEVAGGESHGEGTERAAGPGQAGPGRAPPRGKAAGSGCPPTGEARWVCHLLYLRFLKSQAARPRSALG